MKRKKSKEQKSALYNIEMFFKARNSVIKFYDDYSLISPEAKNEAKVKQQKVRDLKY